MLKQLALCAASLLTVVTLPTPGFAQDAASIDLPIRGGHWIDAQNGIDAVLDVAIASGRVASVAAAIPERHLSARVLTAPRPTVEYARTPS